MDIKDFINDEFFSNDEYFSDSTIEDLETFDFSQVSFNKYCMKKHHLKVINL